MLLPVMKLRWFKHQDSCQVWACLRSTYTGSKLQRLTLLDIPVCQNSFKRLLRLGSGRFLRLIDSVRKGDDDCPMDMRFVKKRFPNKLNSKKRQIVHDFLHHLYETLAEPMPEGTGASKRPRTVKKRDDKTMIATTQLIEKAQPPGSFYEYLAMLRRAHPTGTFSYKLFCSVQFLAFWFATSVADLVCCFFVHRLLFMAFVSCVGLGAQFWRLSQAALRFSSCQVQHLRQIQIDGEKVGKMHSG